VVGVVAMAEGGAQPSRTIDPSKLASAERGDLARVVVATGKIQAAFQSEIKSKASGIVKSLRGLR